MPCGIYQGSKLGYLGKKLTTVFRDVGREGDSSWTAPPKTKEKPITKYSIDMKHAQIIITIGKFQSSEKPCREPHRLR
jgi:hypothetical protein